MLYTKKGVTGYRHSLSFVLSLLIAYTADYIKFVGIFYFLYMKKRFHQGGNFPRRGMAE